MVRTKYLLSNHFAKLAVAAAVLALLLGNTGTANAAIYWNDGVPLVNQASQQCLAAIYDGADPGVTGSTVPGCMARGTSWVWLFSGLPDSGGNANVQIETDGSNLAPLCLEADGPGTGPGPSGAYRTFWNTCYKGYSWQIWTMHTVAPSQDVGNPAGLKHFISFHNLGANACLDGGYDAAYGFPGACNSTNNWQIWNIYTNQTSSPYQG